MKSAWNPWKISISFFLLFWIGCAIQSGLALGQPRDLNLCVKDVPAAFQKIQDHGVPSGFWIKNWRPNGDHYPLSWKDYLRVRKLRKQSHIQGVQRLGDKPYLLMTGSSEGKNVGLFYIGSTQQNSSTGRFETNLTSSNIPNETSIVIKRQDLQVSKGVSIATGQMNSETNTLDHSYNHAGGLQVIGDYAVIALGHGGDPERVLFYDLSAPDKPQKMSYEVGVPRADAVGITKQKSGKYLLVVRGAEDTMYFFESERSNLEDPQFRYRKLWKKEKLIKNGPSDDLWRNYQNINLVTSCEGKIFLLGFARKPGGLLDKNPLKGSDWMDLYSLEMGPSQTPILKKLNTKQMFCDGFCNFAAGGGINITPQGEFLLYGVNHFIPTDQEEMAAQGISPRLIPIQIPTKAAFIKFNEFRSFPPDLPLPLTEPEHSWVAMYDDAHFEGPRVFLEGKDVTSKEWANFKDVWNNFDKKVSSVKWLIPKGYQYGLYRHADFKGQAIWLNGTGNVEKLARLRPLDFNDRPSSSKLLKVRITDSQDGWVELFADPNFDGRRLRITPLVKTCPGSIFHNLKCLKGEVAWEWREHQGFSNYKNLKNVDGKDGFDNKITSVRFQLPPGKRYRLYQHPDYQGNTFDLVGNGLVQEIPDMRKVDKGLNDKFSSSKFLN